MATAIRQNPSRSKKREHHRPGPAPADVAQTLRHRHGMSQELLARLLDVSLRTVSGIESGTVAPTRIARNLAQVGRLSQALSEAMAPAYVGHWLQEPNEMLNGLKPVEAIERGLVDLVWQVIEGLRTGSPL
jgi:DNA-binding XRE family transcriptional regulator